MPSVAFFGACQVSDRLHERLRRELVVVVGVIVIAVAIVVLALLQTDSIIALFPSYSWTSPTRVPGTAHRQALSRGSRGSPDFIAAQVFPSWISS